ncbi:hypothetical protein DV517_09890 [Streptomyces sp. S816]|nr:hypothetical protein DV517_09890 [Streptomyces sp. S816]
MSTLTLVTDENPPDFASEDPPAEVGRVRFPFVRWVLAPRTTWQARCLAADFGEGMDAKTAWAMARLVRHPDEHGYAMAHLDDERRATE